MPISFLEKESGAWMTSFKQYIKTWDEPHISNVCNFTKPTETKPSLLTFEVTTLFHEFGHGLHGMLANTTYQLIWNLGILGFCRITKSGDGKLVLRTRSFGFICNSL
jgi:hypothetical protein